MESLTKWLHPDIVVLTKLSAVPVHVEYFSCPEAVAEEKMKLVSALRPDGVLIYNHDDEIIEKYLPSVLQRKVGFGRLSQTDFTARKDRTVYQDDIPVGTEFTIQCYGNDHTVSVMNTIGVQHAYACAAALAVADELSVPIDISIDSLQSLRTPNGRMRLLSGIKSTLIIDDSYNSSPVAVEHALSTLKELAYVKRKIAVLGDMLELGKFSTDEHKRIGSLVPGAAQVLFTVGVRAHSIAEGALAAGMSEKHIFQYDDAAKAGRELQAILSPGDVVLIKASQGVRAERIVEEVMRDPENAGELLVRQEKKWHSIA
jgi:UDP-N-acetylmuramoyl-tripeptide--D-alanyl-D-alanine ligase